MGEGEGREKVPAIRKQLRRCAVEARGRCAVKEERRREEESWADQFGG